MGTAAKDEFDRARAEGDSTPVAALKGLRKVTDPSEVVRQTAESIDKCLDGEGVKCREASAGVGSMMAGKAKSGKVGPGKVAANPLGKNTKTKDSPSRKPSTSAKSLPSGGLSPSEFGELIRWPKISKKKMVDGRRVEDRRLTQDEMVMEVESHIEQNASKAIENIAEHNRIPSVDNQITKGHVQQWADQYKEIHSANPNNPSALSRSMYLDGLLSKME